MATAPEDRRIDLLYFYGRPLSIRPLSIRPLPIQSAPSDLRDEPQSHAHRLQMSDTGEGFLQEAFVPGVAAGGVGADPDRRVDPRPRPFFPHPAQHHRLGVDVHEGGGAS